MWIPGRPLPRVRHGGHRLRRQLRRNGHGLIGVFFGRPIYALQCFTSATKLDGYGKDVTEIPGDHRCGISSFIRLRDIPCLFSSYCLLSPSSGVSLLIRTSYRDASNGFDGYVGSFQSLFLFLISLVTFTFSCSSPVDENHGGQRDGCGQSDSCTRPAQG